QDDMQVLDVRRKRDRPDLSIERPEACDAAQIRRGSGSVLGPGNPGAAVSIQGAARLIHVQLARGGEGRGVVDLDLTAPTRAVEVPVVDFAASRAPIHQ